MNRRTGLFIAWLAATLTGILIATAAVGSVRDNVAERPTSVIPPAQTIESLASSTTSSSTEPSIPSSVQPTPPTTQTGGTITTSTSPAPPITGSQTTQPSASGEIKTINGQGGSMSVEVYSDHLVFLGAVPASGFTIEEQHIEDKEISVKFKSSDHETKLEAKLEDGGFKQKVDEGDDD